MARVLVAGCGYVGSALAALLAADGDEVWGLRRVPEGLPAGVHPLAADLTRPETLAALPPALDLVLFTAAADGGDDAAYRAVYVDGLAGLLAALRAQGQAPGRVLFTSSTGVYGQADGAWVDETSPTEPAGFSGRRMREAEEILAAGGVPSVSLRLGGIYGPGRHSLIDRVRAGTATCPPAPSWTNRIHRDDAAGALRHLARHPSPDPVYVGVDREPAESCAVLGWIADRLGVPRPPRGDAPSGRGANKRCRSDRLAESGYVFRYPTFREGFGALLDAEARG